MRYSSLVNLEKARVDHEVVDSKRAWAMAQLLLGERADRGAFKFLPPLWHWIYFHETPRSLESGLSFFARESGQLRRIWVGGSVEFLSPIVVGCTLRRLMRLTKLTSVECGTGTKVSISIDYVITSERKVCIREERKFVFFSATASNFRARSDALIYQDAGIPAQTWHPDEIQLANYSELTASTNRIHFDRDFATLSEGYGDLVVHSPLIATKLARVAVESDERHLFRIEYSSKSALTLGNSIQFHISDKSMPVRTLEAVSKGINVMNCVAIFRD